MSIPTKTKKERWIKGGRFMHTTLTSCLSMTENKLKKIIGKLLKMLW